MNIASSIESNKDYLSSFSSCLGCSQVSLCLHGLKKRYDQCHYRHVEQTLIGRNSAVYGAEILSRPHHVESCCYEEYFSTLRPAGHNDLLMELLDKLLLASLTSQVRRKYHYFVNVERFSLLDSKVIRKLIEVAYMLKNVFDSQLVIEVTERNSELSKFTIERKFELKDAGIKIALDDYVPQIKSDLALSVDFFDYIKIDIRDVALMLSKLEEKDDFINFLYSYSESGGCLVAEKIESESELVLASNLPFKYYQGYYFNKM